jgi:hypothetical protein
LLHHGNGQSVDVDTIVGRNIATTVVDAITSSPFPSTPSSHEYPRDRHRVIVTLHCYANGQLSIVHTIIND